MFSNFRCSFTLHHTLLHNHVITKQLLQVLQLCACVLATLQTAWLCAHRLIRTSSQCVRPLTDYVCVYNVLLFFNFFSMLSTSYFIQLEGVKGGSLYFMKLNRCHSANIQDGEGTQCFIYISYRKHKKKKKPPSLRVPLGLPPAAKECKDKDRGRV